jgi:REP element-mobilizing transposase RayT
MILWRTPADADADADADAVGSLPKSTCPKHSPRSSLYLLFWSLFGLLRGIIALFKMSPKRQLSLRFRTWGGERRGAGRPTGQRPRVRHRQRPEHCREHPVHVTMRSQFRPLRTRFVFPTLRDAIRDANRSAAALFRIVHFSVQADHLHLLVEARDKASLSAGMRGFAIRVARRINQLVRRKGRVWADRWHGRELTAPRAVRNALQYVLFNFRKHRAGGTRVDSFSSGPHFDGFLELGGLLPVDVMPELSRAPPLPVAAAARTWLLGRGWRRHGLIHFARAFALCVALAGSG